MRFSRSILSIALGTSIATTATALDYPIGITNCGVQSWIPNSPQRAVTMNQGTTEVMLALGLEDRMAGTAYLDDYIWPELVSDLFYVCSCTPNIDKLHTNI